MSRGLVVAIAAGVALVGCGGGDDSSSSSSAAAGPPPADLIGAYTTTLKPGDLPARPPPELTDGSNGWTIKIAKTGGPGGGPTLTIANDENGVLESPKLAVGGNTIYLRQEECANAAGSDTGFVNSRYPVGADREDAPSERCEGRLSGQGRGDHPHRGATYEERLTSAPTWAQPSCSASPMMMPSGPRMKQSR